MIFISNAEGTIVKVAPSSIQQGTNEGNEIILFAPFVGNVELLCILPNGTRAEPIPMTPLFELEKTELTNIPASVQSEYIGKSVWRVLIPYAVTEFPGVLQVQFKITIPNGEVGEGENISRGIKTSTSNVYINPGYCTKEENPQETDKTAIANAAATAAKGYREGAEAWAVGTKENKQITSPAENDATYKTTPHKKNNAAYYAEQAGDALSEITPMHDCIKKKHDDIDAWHEDIVTKHDDIDAWHEDIDAWHEDIDAWHEDIDAWHEDIVTKHEEIKTWHGETETNAQDVKEIYDKLTKIMTFRGPVEDIPEIKKVNDSTYKDENGILYKNGDVIVITEGEYAELEFVLWEGKWIKLADISAENKAIGELQASVGALQEYAESNHIEKTYAVETKGWYRIAALSGSTYNNLVQLYAKAKNGYTNVSLFATSGSHTPSRYGNIPEITPIISSHYHARPVNQIRIQYVNVNGSGISQHSYLEIYATKQAEIKISTLVNMGWSFYDEIEAVTTALPTDYAAVVQSLNDIEENIDNTTPANVEAITESDLKSILI